MLSEETALSNNSRTTVNWLSSFLNNSAKFKFDKPSNKDSRLHVIWNSLSNFDDLPILVMSKSGYAIFEYFSKLPTKDLTIVTNNTKLKKIAALYRNEITVIEENIDETIPLELLWKIVSSNRKELFKNSNQVAAVFVSKYVNTPRANSITVFDKSDFVFS